MAGPIIPPYALNDLLKVRVLTVFRTQIAVNVLHYACVATSGAGAGGVTVAQAFSQLFGNYFPPLMSSLASYRGVGVQRISPILDIELTDISHSAVGTMPGAPCPPQDSPYVTTLVGPGGRKNRGRIFLPFPGSGALASDGSVVALYKTSMDALLTACIGPITMPTGGPDSVSWQLVVMHRKTRTYDKVGSWLSRPFFGSQVRRSLTRKTDSIPF